MKNTILACILAFFCLQFCACESTKPTETTAAAGTTIQPVETIETTTKETTPISDFYYEENENGGITITGYKGVATNIIIPAQIDEKPVTEIGNVCFSWNSKTAVVSVSLPDTIESIGNGAFENCASLASIEFPDTLKAIGTRAFANCTALKHITIPAGSLNAYSWEAFHGAGLETVTFQEGVEMIPETAFAGTNIREVVLPSTMRELRFQAFGGCRNLEKVTLNEGLQQLGSRVFIGSKITELSIPASVTEISELSLQGCPRMESVIFNGNAPAEFVDSMSSADGDSYTIYYHRDAHGFSYPRWNGHPTEIIGEKQKERPVFADFEYQENGAGGITILAYIGDDPEVVIPAQIHGKNVTEIGMCAFKYNQTLVSVKIPETVTTIGFRAFANCFSLESVSLLQGLTTIHGQAFAVCRKLASITLPSTLTELGYDAFSNCTALKEIRIPKSLSVWGKGIFAFSALETVVLEEGLSCIGEGALIYILGLSEIVIPASVTDIKETTFEGCSRLTAVKFEGNAPANYENADPEEMRKLKYTVYYHDNASGFTTPMWCGYATEIW